MERRDFLKKGLLFPLVSSPLEVLTECSRESKSVVPSDDRIIVLDPGHGNLNSAGIYDPGAISYDGKHHEADLVLDLSKHIQTIFGNLDKNDFFYSDVRATRTKSHVKLSLGDRVDFANVLGANTFVSLHYNSSPSQEPRGVNVYHYPKSHEGRRLAGFVYDEILGYLNKHVSDFENTHGGVRKSDFYVLRNTKMPAILVEGGFLSNPKDLDYILKFSPAIAGGIATGLCKYFADIEKRKG